MNMDKKSSYSPRSEAKVASPNSPSTDLLANLGRFAEKSQDTSRDFGAEFFSMYRAIFPPKSCSTPSPLPSSLTPSTRSSTSSAGGFGGDEGEISATEHRLNQARLILERQQLSDHYDLCQKQLHGLNKEIDFLRLDNAELRSINAELLRILSSPAALRSFLLNHANSSSSFGLDNVVGDGNTAAGSRVGLGITAANLSPELSNTSDEVSDISPTSVIEPNRFERRNNNNNSVDRVSLPKSISVRSTGYQKSTAIASQSSGREGPSRSSSNRPRSVPSQLAPGTQRVYVPGVVGEKDQEESGGPGGLELEVFNQGMFKTELCNKWQQTGACPYGDHCQFAHGITELRPVIRHPRYKTEICRMVLSGDPCPYGHRCHFRHSLTEEERSLLPR